MTQDNSTAQLLPCPFCGGTDLTTTHTTGFWAQCEASGCQAEGPVKASEDEAIAAWNTRAPVSQDAEQLVERLRHYATKVHHEPMEAAMREAADLIEALTRPQPSIRDMGAQEADGQDFIEALTPSAETKAAYSGEFTIPWPVVGEDGNDHIIRINVPWTTIKEIMAAIRARAETHQGDSTK